MGFISRIQEAVDSQLLRVSLLLGLVYRTELMVIR